MSDPVLGAGSLVAGRYRISGLIARGGMGAVHAAVDERLSREVALKTLRPELVEDSTLVARFEREARTAARLAHPCIAQVLDFGTSPEGLLYLVMERVRGETLATLLKREGRLAPLRAADIVEQTLGALASAHAEGVVHRDLKPGNIMIVPSGESRETVKLLDFGIAHLMDGAAYTRLTQTGVILGTPTYMSPEQALGERIDARTDVYAMGVILWCLLTGQKPFSGPSMADVVEAILNTPPPLADALAPEVPNELARVADFAMQKDRERRFVDANAMGRALVAFRSREPVAPRAASRLPQPPAPSPDARMTQTEMTQAPPQSAFALLLASTAHASRRTLTLAAGALGLLTSACLLFAAVGLAFGMGLLTPDGDPSGKPLGGFALPVLAREPTSEVCAQAVRCCEAYSVAATGSAGSCGFIVMNNASADNCAFYARTYARALEMIGRDASMCTAPSTSITTAAAPPMSPIAPQAPSPVCAQTERCCRAYYLRFGAPNADIACAGFRSPLMTDSTCARPLQTFRERLTNTGVRLAECE